MQFTEPLGDGLQGGDDLGRVEPGARRDGAERRPQPDCVTASLRDTVAQQRPLKRVVDAPVGLAHPKGGPVYAELDRHAVGLDRALHRNARQLRERGAVRLLRQVHVGERPQRRGAQFVAQAGSPREFLQQPVMQEHPVRLQQRARGPRDLFGLGGTPAPGQHGRDTQQRAFPEARRFQLMDAVQQA
ncbi:MAG: hypothetical protein ICCCNLDF_00304 [Planctomycetes bacterium]|nr:hypothetical protein [Planctomycetota bacterium]